MLRWRKNECLPLCRAVTLGRRRGLSVTSMAGAKNSYPHGDRKLASGCSRGCLRAFGSAPDATDLLLHE